MTRGIIIAVAGIGMLGCDGSAEPRVPTSLNLSRSNLTLHTGESTIVSATVRDQSGTALDDQEIIWTTSDPAVAIVDDGTITGVGRGATVIRATSGSLWRELTVRVLHPDTLVISHSTVQVPIGNHVTVYAVIRDDDGNSMDPPPPGYEVTWTSSNPAVAHVSDRGMISGIAEGEASVTAMAGDLPPASVDVRVVRPFAITFAYGGVRTGSFSVSGYGAAERRGSAHPSRHVRPAHRFTQ